jgi:sugar lactone lactonase YvrE
MKAHQLTLAQSPGRLSVPTVCRVRNIKGISIGALPSPLVLLFAALSGGVGLRAQSDYATPYTFTTLAGQTGVVGYNDGTGVNAHFSGPQGLTVDGSGNLFVADADNGTIRKVTPAGVVTLFAGIPEVLSPPNGLLIASGSGFLPDNGTGSAAHFVQPGGIVADGAGNLYVTDGSATIRKITPAGMVTTLAGGPPTGIGSPEQDGIGMAAIFENPEGIAIDSSGNLYVADSGGYTIRKVSPTGNVTTLAGLVTQFGSTNGTGTVARFSVPKGVAVDANGNVFVADSGNYLIRKITPAGVVTTLAGTAGVAGSVDGTGSAAQFSSMNGIAIDANGNLYVTDANNTIRKITSAGVVTTLAGTPNVSGSSNGTGAAALFSNPSGIAVDASGDLFVADAGNDTIRESYTAPNAAPTISTQPTAQSVALYSSVTFSVAASGVPAPGYQWMLNGSPVAGATNPTLTIDDVQADNLGSYSVWATNSSGSAASGSVTLSSPGVTPGAPSSPPAPSFVNISTRAVVGTAAALEIAGFVVSGPPGSSAQLLVRADGLSLSGFQVAGFLAEPVLTIFNSAGTQVATASSWGVNPDAAQLAEAALSVGAFLNVVPTLGDWDAALLISLPPGAYTAQISGTGGSTGVALAEIYQVGGAPAQLVNISTRASVGTGASIEIAGLVIQGSQPTRVLIRAIGPTLTNFSVSGVLAQPTLTVFDSSGNMVATNTGWSTNANAATIATEAATIGAFALPSGSADCALLLTLQPGAYTAQVSGVGGATGIALVEAYQAP